MFGDSHSGRVKYLPNHVLKKWRNSQFSMSNMNCIEWKSNQTCIDVSKLQPMTRMKANTANKIFHYRIPQIYMCTNFTKTTSIDWCIWRIIWNSFKCDLNNIIYKINWKRLVERKKSNFEIQLENTKKPVMMIDLWFQY